MDDFSMVDIVNVLNEAVEYAAKTALEIADVIPVIYKGALDAVDAGIREALMSDDKERVKALVELMGGEEKFIKLVNAMKLGHYLLPAIKERIINEWMEARMGQGVCRPDCRGVDRESKGNILLYIMWYKYKIQSYS